MDFSFMIFHSDRRERGISEELTHLICINAPARGRGISSILARERENSVE